MIDNKTQLNLVIGHPLTHSKSPILHNMIYNMMHCNTVMLAHETQDLEKSIAAIKAFRVGLTAVTMPHKSNIVSYLDQVSDEVKELQVANTIINRHGMLSGYNTDIDGIAHALRHTSLSSKNVLMIGAGGASHAAGWYLRKNNANLIWLNRTEEKARALQSLFGGSIADKKQLHTMQIDIIINTTPIGMFPETSHSPLPDYPFRSDQVVFDMVYNPVETRLLKDAKQHGAICISGLDMFIGQGLKQIELWLEKKIMTENILEMAKAELLKSKMREIL